KIPSNRIRNDHGAYEARGCCRGGTSGFGQIIAVGPGHAFDHTDPTKSTQLARQPAGREHGQVWQEVSTADAGDVDPGVLQGAQQRGVTKLEEIDSFDGTAVDQTRLGQAVEGADPGREVIQGGQVSEIASIASE